MQYANFLLLLLASYFLSSDLLSAAPPLHPNWYNLINNISLLSAVCWVPLTDVVMLPIGGCWSCPSAEQRQEPLTPEQPGHGRQVGAGVAWRVQKDGPQGHREEMLWVTGFISPGWRVTYYSASLSVDGLLFNAALQHRPHAFVSQLLSGTNGPHADC